jgi:hypothetical protein
MSEEEKLFLGAEYSAPHKAKLDGLLKNKKLPTSDWERVQDALVRYQDWSAAMRGLLDADGDERVEEHIPYPFYGSPMWEEWEGSREISFPSGPLSCFRTAS